MSISGRVLSKRGKISSRKSRTPTVTFGPVPTPPNSTEDATAPVFNTFVKVNKCREQTRGGANRRERRGKRRKRRERLTFLHSIE